ncbi:FAD-dependent oxidoreductase, partial [Thermodesulfovibrionales bacterium]|nr:FAD-dependent oxidoreductase [Thermodesulfovibrionales bacterium]
AILVSTFFTEPFSEPISYGTYISRLANLIGNGVIVQRLGDIMNGRRSTAERISKGIVEPTLKDATPGDLSFVLPYRYLFNILEMLAALDKIAPGVNSRHTLIYGVEVKFYSMRVNLTDSFETEITDLFTIGDGAGVSRGLIQASVSGVITAREILRRYGRL